MAGVNRSFEFVRFKENVMSFEKPSSSSVLRVQDCHKKLASAAANLNSASDRLGKPVADLDAYLRKLGLGISSFVSFRTWNSSGGLQYSVDELGYTKLAGKWGLAIRTRAGNEGQPDDESSETWHFAEAPRLLRVQAIKAIPELLEKLFSDATRMAETVEEQAKELCELTAAMGLASAEKLASESAPAHELPASPKAALGTSKMTAALPFRHVKAGRNSI
jgi:hypothetical protein